MLEQDIQNLIRLEIAKKNLGVVFRCNVGEAWTGSWYKKNSDGSITIINPRRFKTGLPKGFSDLFGVTNKGRAFFIEVKREGQKPREEQEHFLLTMRNKNALAGVARSIEDAINIILGGNI